MERGEISQPLATAASIAEEQSLAPTGMLGGSPLATIETGPEAPLAPAEEAHPDPLANSTARPLRPRSTNTNTSLSHSGTGDNTSAEDFTVLNDLRRREIEIEKRLLNLELEQIAVEKSLIDGRHSVHLHQEALKMAEVEMATPSRLPGLATSASTGMRSALPGLASGQSFGATAATSPFLNAGPRPSRLTFMDGSVGSKPRETMATAILNQSQILARQGGSKELPQFSGRPEEWAIFIASFESSTDLCGFSDEENMLRLQKALSGKALDAVRSRLLHPANLRSVIDTLRMLFGRPEIIIHQIMQQIRKMPAPRLERMESIINFGVAVQDMCATIEAAGIYEYLCDATLLYELAEKLPDTLRLDWARHRLVLKRATLAEFGQWLNELVHAASLISLPSISGPGTERKESESRYEKPRYHLNVHQMEEQKAASSSRNAVCPVCSGSCSGLTTCKQFSDLAPQERWNTIRRLSLCRKCLKSHGSRCQLSRPCGKNGCGYFHHPLLHDDARYRDPRRPVVESIHTHSVSTGNVLLTYVPITVYGKNRTVDTFAFLDSGSTGTFVERGLAEELNLEGKPFPLCLKWTGDTIREESDSIMLSLNISALGGTKIYKIPKAHTMQRLSLPAQSVCASDLASRYGHLKDIPLPSYTGIRPRIIIGVDNFRLAHPQRYAEGGEHEPIAVKTPLGWMLYGPCTGESGTNTKGDAVAHSLHICDCSVERDKALDTLVTEHFSIESQHQRHQSQQDDPSQQHHCFRKQHTSQCIVPLQQRQQSEQELNQRAQRRKQHGLQAFQQRQWQCQQRQRRQQHRQAMELRQQQRQLRRERIRDQRQLPHQQLLSCMSQCEQTPNTNFVAGWPTALGNQKERCGIRWMLIFLVLLTTILGWRCRLESWTEGRGIVCHDLLMRRLVVDGIDMRWRSVMTDEMIRDETWYELQLTRVNLAVGDSPFTAWRYQPLIFDDMFNGCNVGMSACNNSCVGARWELYVSWTGKDDVPLLKEFRWSNLDWDDGEPGVTHFKLAKCRLIGSGKPKSSAASAGCLERLIISAKRFPIAVFNVTSLISVHFPVGMTSGNSLGFGYHNRAGLTTIPKTPWVLVDGM